MEAFGACRMRVWSATLWYLPICEHGDANSAGAKRSAMKIIMTHGYMLSGTGSNIYVQSLCRALIGEGHDVYLLCQEPDPLAYDFVGQSAKVNARGVENLGEQETAYPGHCVVYRPEIG